MLMESVSTLQSAPVQLTERDRKVLRMLLEGKSNKEIGADMNLSESAAKAALQQLFAKTGVRTRSQLVRVALEKLGGQI
jgi:two-component system nitrate/nitrite response regulator NarL